MATKKRSSFRGKVGKDARKSTRASYGYLNLPEGVKAFSIKEKTRKIQLDILPYVVSDSNHPNKDEELGAALKGDLWYRRPFKIHRNVGAENETCVCPKSVGKPCPICDHQKKRFSEGADKEETKELYPKDRNLYVVIPLDDDFEEEPYIWDMAQSLFQDVLKEELEEDDENEIFPDLEEGKTLEVSFKWKTLGTTTFPEARNISFLNREPYDEDILDTIPDLDKVLRVLTYEQLSNKFFELDEEEDAGELAEVDEEDEKPRRKRPARTSRRVKKEEIEEEEEEEEEEKPKRRTRKPVVKEEEEEEEEDEKPKSSRKVKKESGDPTCPNKHEFGKDFEEFDDCDDCDLWDACYDKHKGK